MLQTRYHLAASLAADKDVLEVAAGPGFGLGWLARKATRVVGVDITPALVRSAHDTHGPGIGLAVADAACLPFASGTFDLVILYEAVYYLPKVGSFFEEARRVLRPGGTLLICTANRRRLGFVRSPYSFGYLDANELKAHYVAHGFSDPNVQGAFSARPSSARQRIVLWSFGLADRIGIIPRSLEGRARFKRLLVSRDLQRLPRTVGPEDGDPARLYTWDERADRAWKVIYTSGVKV